MKKQFRIASKYLIERSHFFSRSQLVLSLQENYLQMQPLSSDREEKEGGVTRIDWDLIISVTASDRNPKEFTILALPENKKKQMLNGQINKAHAQSMVYSCKERNRLLTEMMHKIHIFNGEKPFLIEKAQHQTDIYKEGSKCLVSLRLHPTVIQVVIKPRDSQKRLGGRLGGPSGLKLQGHQNSKSHAHEENKRLFEDSYGESEAYDENATEEYFQDNDDEDEFEAYESEGQGLSGTILTPYKGSMIGGTIIGEESANPGTVNEQNNSLIPRQHFIYLCEIEKIILNQNSLIIVKKNQEIDKFILKSDERVKEFVNWMKKNHKDQFKSVLSSSSVQSFEHDKLFEDIEFLKRDSKPIYTQEVSSYTWDGVVQGLEIQIDETHIYEVDKKLDKIRKKCLLKDLEMIRINDKAQFYSNFQSINLLDVVLMFKKEIEMVIQVHSLSEREKLISNLLNMRSFQIPQQGTIDLMTLLVNSQIDFSQKILGHDPLDTLAQYVQDYEGLIFRKITENINYKDTQKINNLIEEAILNASFANLIKIDQRSIKVIVREIIQQIEKYLSFENSETEIVDKLLKKHPDDHIIDFLAYKKKQSTKTPGNNNVSSTIPDLSQNLQIDTYNEETAEKAKSYEKLSETTAKYLNMLNLFLNSKIFLAEIQEYEELMSHLIRMLICKNSYLSFLASQVLKASIHHYSGTESKTETTNKKILVRGKNNISGVTNQGEQQYGSIINQNLLNQDITEPILFIQALKDYLFYFQSLLDSTQQVKSLHIYGLSNILKSLLQSRRQTTSREDFKIFADMITEDDIVYLTVLENEKKNPQLNQSQTIMIQNKKEDPLKNKPMFHLIDQFCLLGSQHSEVQYFFTLMLNESLNYYKRYESDKLSSFQHYILTYSIQFVWHLYLQQESSIKEQRKVSIQTISKVLYQNLDSISLLLRCFPKTLLEKVETHIDAVQSQTWNDQEWEDFFFKVTYKNYDTATEQWNNETRNELKLRLSQELNEFLEAKRIHQIVIMDDTKRELVLPNHEFNRAKKVISRSINLKWNYMEFGIKYRCLLSKYLVWKYYLTKLLVEQNLNETQKPYFTQDIKKPSLFWQELKIKFMSSFDNQEQIIILKIMSVLYNKHYQILGDLKTIPYLLRLFEQQQYEHCHFILLQLMHVSLSIDKEFAIKNMKKFIKAGGLTILMNLMKLVFKELLRSDRGTLLQKNPQLLVLSTFSRDQYEKMLHGQGVLKDQANFTNSKTNSRYFKRNSEYVCMGLISLKILDLIFVEMCALDYVPLPTNREFLLRLQSLAILTQILMIENVDLTRELTIFIQTHMNNHYSYFKLKNSGMIEYLILCLSSKNGDRALEILQKFQEVSFDFNNHLKLGLFNSNDLKMLQDDKEKVYKSQFVHGEQENLNDQSKLGETKKYTILAESIFLRYLPIPFIKFLYEEGQQRFLEIYKMQHYESPILIWNTKLREILEVSIREHSSEFIEELKEFAQQESHLLKTSENLPIYDKKFKNIVKYPDIENEVRCGRYYLRVWVNQKKKDSNFFDIPRDEEDEFHKNLQIELRHCIYEENFQDQSKIIILFKACLQALHRFNTKRIVSLDEIKKILMETCKNQPVYNETVKQMVYIGIKIINLVVRQESQYYFINSGKTNADSLREVLTKIGVEIIGEIFNLILKNSFNSSHLSMSYSRAGNQGEDKEEEVQENEIQEDNNADQNKKITIDRIEAKTLSLCIQSFNIILNTDIQAFVDFPLANRINLFKQISRLIDVSFNLIPLFKDKLLSNQVYTFDSTTYGSYNQQPVQSPSGKNSKKKSKSRRSKSKRKAKQANQGAHNNQQSWQMINVTNNNQSSYNPHLGQIFSKPTQNQLFMELDKYALAKQKDLREHRKIHKKDPLIDYKQQSLLEIILEKMDKHSIELIFDITRSIFELTREITKNPVLHPELIASGMAWKALKYIYFSLKEETNQFQDLKASLREATVTLKNIISFAHQLANYGAESFAFKNLTKETEKEIMKNFWKCIKSIFVQKIQETLISQFVITNNELLFASYDPRRFLQQFSVREENSPELVWNNETRVELLTALDEQIMNLHNSFFDKLITFGYSVNKRELRVEDIFIRHFNNQNEFKPADLENFSSKLVEKLKEYTDFKFVADLDNEQYQNTLELLKALRIILVNENLIINDPERFEEYLCTFCNLILIKTDDQGNSNPTQEEIDNLKGVSSIILDIIQHISKSGGGLHFDYLKICNEFIKLLIRTLYGKEKEIVDSSITIQILQSMLTSKEIDINEFLINTGLIMFILNQIFEKKSQNSNKKERVELIKLILQASSYTQGIYSKFIPLYFFVEIQSKQITDPDTEKIIEFIKELDALEFENVFIIWNSQLKNESHQRIKNNCEQIVQSYDNSSHSQVHLDLNDLYNPRLENEVIVSDVIVRLYNKNPAVFINIKLNSFINYLTQEIQKIAQELYKMGQQHRDDFAMDDMIGREGLSGQNQNVQKKFKALCNQALMLLTSLLLSMEQLLLNDYNPNRVMASKKEDKNAEAKFYRNIIEKLTDQTQLDQKVYQIIGFWLQTQVFMAKHIPIEIRLTFLQIIFLMIDVTDAVKALKENGDSLLNFLYDSINIEEAMILLITQKLLRKDPDTTPKLINSSMQKLFKIYEKKRKLKKIVEFILALMASDMQYKQSAIKIDTKVIMEGRHDNSEHAEAIMRIWRGKPTSASDAKRFYEYTECYYIEDQKVDDITLSKLKLPLLSIKSYQHYKKEELYYEDEKKQKTYDLPQVSKNLKGKSGDVLSLQASKESKLGFQPILDDVSRIGGIDLEEIEKKEIPFIEEGEEDT